MTILKNGKILKEPYYFECPSCDCHWTANYNEVERFCASSIYVMRCPQCLRQKVEAKYNNYDPAKTNATENGALYSASANVDPNASAYNSYVDYNNKSLSTNYNSYYNNKSLSTNYNSYYNNKSISTNTHL